jgi:hypothetical protein
MSGATGNTNLLCCRFRRSWFHLLLLFRFVIIVVGSTATAIELQVEQKVESARGQKMHSTNKTPNSDRNAMLKDICFRHNRCYLNFNRRQFKTKFWLVLLHFFWHIHTAKRFLSYQIERILECYRCFIFLRLLGLGVVLPNFFLLLGGRAGGRLQLFPQRS